MTSINTTTWIPLTSSDQLTKGAGIRKTIWPGVTLEGALASATPDCDGDYRVENGQGYAEFYIRQEELGNNPPGVTFEILATPPWEPLTAANQAMPGDRIRRTVKTGTTVRVTEDIVQRVHSTGALRLRGGDDFGASSIAQAASIGHTYEIQKLAPRPEPLDPDSNKKHRLVKANGHTWYYSYFGEPQGRYVNLAYQADAALTPRELESRYPDREILDYDYSTV